ncbi:prepilin-type N-terminal cleavage/methylation domain-containing protein [Pseudomonas frederiksbergensis]|uniref:type II secretion system protein n=1 Tax=Pseudomonas TaxID=286 RepID=UPI003D1A0077
MARRNSQRGFTLIEIAIALAILSTMALVAAPSFIEELNDRRANVTIQETQTILDAARVYRQQTGLWPDTGVCANALAVLKGTSPPLLAGIGTVNKYNSNISTSCTATTFSVDQDIVQDWDGVVANGLPGSQVTNAASHTVRSTVGIPGSEAGLYDKLSRTNTGDPELNTMRTNLHMGNQNIDGANDISSATVNATGNVQGGTLSVSGRATMNEYVQLTTTAVESAGCPATGLVSRTAGGQPLYCQGGIWAKPITWNTSTVASGSGCGNYPKGSMGFDASGRLYVCK